MLSQSLIVNSKNYYTNVILCKHQTSGTFETIYFVQTETFLTTTSNWKTKDSWPYKQKLVREPNKVHKNSFLI